MKHISLENFNSHEVEKYSKEFKSNSPYPYIVIDNFLAKDSADKVLDNFKINENWINVSLVNNYKKYQIKRIRNSNPTRLENSIILAKEPLI